MNESTQNRFCAFNLDVECDDHCAAFKVEIESESGLTFMECRRGGFEVTPSETLEEFSKWLNEQLITATTSPQVEERVAEYHKRMFGHEDTPEPIPRDNKGYPKTTPYQRCALGPDGVEGFEPF